MDGEKKTQLFQIISKIACFFSKLQFSGCLAPLVVRGCRHAGPPAVCPRARGGKGGGVAGGADRGTPPWRDRRWSPKGSTTCPQPHGRGTCQCRWDPSETQVPFQHNTEGSTQPHPHASSADWPAPKLETHRFQHSRFQAADRQLGTRYTVDGSRYWWGLVSEVN